MEDSDCIAIAAHLHVALRRKTGRVTDTEWMARNLDYGRAMVGFALTHARENDDIELARLALKLDAALDRLSHPRALRVPHPPAATDGDTRPRQDAGDTQAPARDFAPPPSDPASPARERVSRYIGGLR